MEHACSFLVSSRPQPHHGTEAEVPDVEGGKQAEGDVIVDLGSGSGGGSGDVQDCLDPADGSHASESAYGRDVQSI